MSEQLHRYIYALEDKLEAVEDGRYTPNPHGVNILVGLAVAQGLKDVAEGLEALRLAVDRVKGELHIANQRSPHHD